MLEKQIVDQLVQFAINTRFDEIPTDVREFTKGVILKSVAGMLVGSTMPSGRKMAALINNRRLPEEVGIIGCGFKTSLWEAVFLNAFLGHAAEMADDYTTVPIGLSCAERWKVTGKELLTAVAVGLEVNSRVCFFQNKQTGVAFVAGPVAPALAAARIMGLTHDETRSALAIATPNIGGTYMNMGTDAHYFESAYYTLQALIAVEMAKEGMTGNPLLVTFLSNILGKENVKAERITGGLGSTWVFCHHWIKKYPCCFRIHRYVDALLELRGEVGFAYDDVESITADIGPTEEFCDRPDPRTETDLQFSFQNALGAVLLDGEINLQHVDKQAVDDLTIAQARKKVNTVMHPEWPNDDVGSEPSVPARIVVRMKNGTEFSKERLNTVGSWPEPPLNREEILQLYHQFSRGILPEELIIQTGKAISDLESLTNLNDLMRTLRSGTTL
jgi:2-methylcitrate dehydratase PrpD